MQDFTFTQEHYHKLLTSISEINQKLSEKNLDKNFTWIDNIDFMRLLKISRRTAQSYRDNNLISFTLIGNKLYYRMSDVEDLLNRFQKERMV